MESAVHHQIPYTLGTMNRYATQDALLSCKYARLSCVRSVRWVPPERKRFGRFHVCTLEDPFTQAQANTAKVPAGCFSLRNLLEVANSYLNLTWLPLIITDFTTNYLLPHQTRSPYNRSCRPARRVLYGRSIARCTSRTKPHPSLGTSLPVPPDARRDLLLDKS